VARSSAHDLESGLHACIHKTGRYVLLYSTGKYVLLYNTGKYVLRGTELCT
jgi:hypothetical protein